MTKQRQRNAREARAINVEIASAARHLQLEEAEFLCECARARCAERVVVPLSEFERVSAGNGYFVFDEHGDLDEVIARRVQYTIVTPAQ
jgi:hypothetical protein